MTLTKTGNGERVRALHLLATNRFFTVLGALLGVATILGVSH